MSKHIKAADLISAIEDLNKRVFLERRTAWAILKEIGQLPTVEVDEWIKVEDALPSKRGFHIVTIEDEYGQRWTDVARYNRMDNDALNDIYRFDVAPIIGKVVAWKPLPEAFTKESEA